MPVKLVLDELLNSVLRKLHVEPNQNRSQDVRRLLNLVKEDLLHILHILWILL